MGRILTIAHHTVREAIRMKVVLAFALLLVALIGILPFAIQRPNTTVTATVQTFLTWSILPLGGILSFLAIFLGCLSISDEMYHRQIYMLVTKPIPRWQYVIGKWVGVLQVLTALLVFSGLLIYGMTRLLASAKPVDVIDAFSLEYEVLTARAHSALFVPDFRAPAERLMQQMVEDGRYNDQTKIRPAKVRADLIQSYRQGWRIIKPGEVREYEFRNLELVDRSAGEAMQLRYKAKGMGYAMDETLQTVWVFGNPRDADQAGPVLRRDVMDRYHVIQFPTSCVSPNGTLTIRVQNIDHDRPDHHGATIAFEAGDGLEVLYKIGSFEGNMVRMFFLVWCRVVAVASIAILAATFLSYPVACLLAFMFYILAISGSYVIEAMGYGGDTAGAYGAAKPAIKATMEVLYWLMPKFSEYNGLPIFVDGRSVTLMWDLQAAGKLVLVLSTILLMIACLIFRRRQVAELSV